MVPTVRIPAPTLTLLVAALIVVVFGAAQPAPGFDRAALLPQPDGVPWPTRAWPEGRPATDVDTAALERALDDAFAAVGWSGKSDTRALLAVHRGRLVVERYADGFDRETRFHSWSMAKTITQALVGILVHRRRIDLDTAPGFSAWSASGDPRAALTIRHLIHMNTGLANADGFEDDDLSGSFVSRLLFGAGSSDVVRYAADVPLDGSPGKRWAYSTGTSMLLADVVARAVGDGRQDTIDFMRSALFERIGMRSAEPEFDRAGNFLGGGFVWANARDWARFGLLYLRDGRWEGERVFGEGWVDFSRTPAPAENNRVFGAHLWLRDTPGEGQFPVMAGLPDATFGASGNSGQYVLVIPTHELVLVRLGELQTLDFAALHELLVPIVDSFPLRPDAGGGR